MHAVVRTSPDRLAIRYGLFAGGATALLDVGVFVSARIGMAALVLPLSLLLMLVFVRSLVLFVQLGYRSGRHGGTPGMAAGLGGKAAILYGLVASVGPLAYMAGVSYTMSLSPAMLVTGVLVPGILGSLFFGLIGAALALLGAAVAQRRFTASGALRNHL